MTIPMHVRVSALGELGNPAAETFSYGFTLVPMGSASSFRDRWNSLPAGDWEFISTLVRALHISTAASIQPTARLARVKLALVGDNPAKPHHPAYLEPPKEYNVLTGQGVATANALVLPQTALVVSLGTAGLGKVKGRFYLPMVTAGASPTDGFRVPLAAAEAIRGAVQTMFNSIRTQDIGGVADDLKPAIISGPTALNPIRGFFTEVATVRVGRVLDTMQSRRRALVESYTSTVPLSG